MSRMTKLADIEEAELAAAEIKSALLGRRCWYAYVSVGNTPRLVLGRRLPRPLDELEARRKVRYGMAARGQKPNPQVMAQRRKCGWDKFRGESELLVWCAWRLDRQGGTGTSWDDKPDRCEAGIRSLIGQTVSAVEITDRWDLVLEFNGKSILRVFPDHIGASASFDGNWELWRPDQLYSVGTDLMCKVVDRQEQPVRLRPASGRWKPVSRARIGR